MYRYRYRTQYYENEIKLKMKAEPCNPVAEESWVQSCTLAWCAPKPLLLKET
jgi:hypothetical protein